MPMPMQRAILHPCSYTLGAKIKVGSKKGERVMSLEEFYTDLFETAMEHDEMVLEVQVPLCRPKTACAYKKFNLLQNDMGVVGVAARVTVDAAGTITDARVVLGNAGVTPIRAKSAEKALIGKKLDEAVFVAAGEACGRRCGPCVRYPCVRRFQKTPGQSPDEAYGKAGLGTGCQIRVREV